MTADPTELGADQRRFFFVHLMKTGGTVISMALRRQFGREAIYPPSDIPQTVHDSQDLQRLLDLWPHRRHSLFVVAGHFPLCASSMLGTEFETFTVLRHPVDRTISLLRKHRSRLDEDDPATLADVYSDPFLFKALIENHMVKMLGLDPDEMTHAMMTPITFESRHLEAAMANLTTVDVVGLHPHIDEFARDLERSFGWDLGEVGEGNASAEYPVPAGLADRIAEDNELDMELFQFAVRLCEERRDRA